MAGECVEIAGQRGDERFAFAGLHLGDFAGVQDHSADHLNVEVTHADYAATGFADDGEGFRQELIEDGFLDGDDLFRVGDAFDGLGDAGAELDGLCGELFVGQGLEAFLKAGDDGERGEELLYGAFVCGAEDFCEGCVEQEGILFSLPRSVHEAYGYC